MQEEKKPVLEIEKMAELAEARREGDTNITFDNEGNMVVHNRAFDRNGKRLWRAVMEDRPSIHFFTKKKKKATRKAKKQERQNKKKGRK